MANFEKLIPFILYFEAGLKREHLSLPLPQMFDKARTTGYADDPADRGGATMCGVTIAAYRAYRKNRGFPVTTAAGLKAIPYREWRDILKSMYWDRWMADRIGCQALTNLLVDFVWASGVHGIKVPQRVLGVTVDGVVGPRTLAALGSAEPRALFARLHEARLRFVDSIVRSNPSQAKFLRGWKRRINCITYDGLKYE